MPDPCEGETEGTAIFTRATHLLAIDVQVCFWNLGSLFEFQAAFFAVAPKQSAHRFRMRGKIRQCFLDRHRQIHKFLEVFVVGSPLLRLLP